MIWPVLVESVNEFVSNFQTNYTRIIKLYNDLPADSLLKNENVYDILKMRGINVTIRREFGGNIDAACGQLRAKEVIK